MGVTYQAQVEVFFEKTKYSDMHWRPVSRWELGKDYAFSAAWYQVAVRGWPSDVELIGEEPDIRWEYDFDSKYYGVGEVFVKALEAAESGVWAIELLAHVQRLVEKGLTVRVLSWGE